MSIKSSGMGAQSTECGPSTDKAVTVLWSARQPRDTCRGGQGLASSFSAAQNVNLAGLPSVDMSETPGRPPPTFIIISRIVLPIAALARCPGPNAPQPDTTPQTARAGPFTINSGVIGCVVTCDSVRSKRGSQMAWTAATTTGKCSGRQPAITAFAATISTVAAAMLGPTSPKDTSASRSQALIIAAMRLRVGITTGKPSVS